MPSTNQYLGIEIGGTKLQMMVADEEGKVIQTLRESINASSGADAIRKQIQEGLEKIESREQVIAIGVGFGGPVDWKTGEVKLSHQVRGWGGFRIKSWLKELTGIEVFIENDANTAALGEALKGAGKGKERVFYMTIGSGIGGGLVLDGSIYHGKTPGEAEIGHIRLNKEGDTIESKCSGWAVNKKVIDYARENTDSLLYELSKANKGQEAKALKPALEKGDDFAKNIIDEVADDLAFGLSHVVHLLHPDVIIIGGGLSLLADHLFAPINQELQRYVMQAFHPAPEVIVAALGEEVVPIGAIEMAKCYFKQQHQRV